MCGPATHRHGCETPGSRETPRPSCRLPALLRRRREGRASRRQSSSPWWSRPTCRCKVPMGSGRSRSQRDGRARERLSGWHRARSHGLGSTPDGPGPRDRPWRVAAHAVDARTSSPRSSRMASRLRSRAPAPHRAPCSGRWAGSTRGSRTVFGGASPSRLVEAARAGGTTGGAFPRLPGFRNRAGAC